MTLWKHPRADWWETGRIGPASVNLFKNFDGIWVARLWIVSHWDEGDGEWQRVHDWHLGAVADLTLEEAQGEALRLACRWFGEAAVEIDKLLQREPMRGEGDEG